MPGAIEPTLVRLDLPISGMTCSSCAVRVQRRLNDLHGVRAVVNYATERATVDYDPVDASPEDLAAAVHAAGYEAILPPEGSDPSWSQPNQQGSDPLRTRLVVCALLTIPLLALSMIEPLQFDRWQWLALQLATPVVLWGAWPFHRATWTNLRHGAATMDTLVSVGVLAAYGWSLYALFLGDAGMEGMHMPLALTPSADQGTYLETAGAVTTFLLAGRFFEARAKRRAGAALEALLALGAKDATVLDDDGRERRVPTAELVVGMRFVVRPGERIATDGVVQDGHSAVDQALLTGESMPVEKGPGDEVTGATINAGGRLVVRATRVGADTALGQIGRLVTAAQSGQAPVQRLADRVSAVFVPAVILLALAVLAVGLGTGQASAEAFAAAVSVLIIACPCALGLATPTALLVGTGRGAQLGLLIRGPEVLEATRRIDTVVLDKTGTLTTGRMTLTDIALAEGVQRTEALRLAGAVEQAAEHPIARAVTEAALRELGTLPAVEGFAAVPGSGAGGVVAGRRVEIRRPETGLPAILEIARRKAEAAGRTAVVLDADGVALALLVVADVVRPTSVEAVTQLRALGLRPILLSGDHEQAARAVAAEVGIDEVIAGVLPAGKAEVISRLQAEGRVVAMIGDGVNDAPALAAADLGISLGAGTDVAIEASDLTLVSDDVRGAAAAIRLSRATLRTIRQNLAWAFGYNIAALPLAAAGGLSPTIAGAAMALSSISVVLNALRLRRFEARSPAA